MPQLTEQLSLVYAPIQLMAAPEVKIKKGEMRLCPMAKLWRTKAWHSAPEETEEEEKDKIQRNLILLTVVPQLPVNSKLSGE